jgi:hypothetical protein
MPKQASKTSIFLPCGAVVRVLMKKQAIMEDRRWNSEQRYRDYYQRYVHGNR